MPQNPDSQNQGQNRSGRRNGNESRFREMTAERYAQLKQNPERLQRMKERGFVTDEQIKKWDAGDFSTGDSAENAAAQAAQAEQQAQAIAQGQEVPTGEPLKEMTEEEKAAAERLLNQGSVPDFSGKTPDQNGDNVDASEPPKYSEESENEFYYRAMERREFALLPSPPLKFRRYARYLMQKYDLNSDGRLQQEEWDGKLNQAQGVDTDGDFELREDELIFYLARYAQNRTIFQPNPPEPASQKNLVVSDQPLKIQPLSHVLVQKTTDEAESDLAQEGFGDLSEEEFNAMLEESNEELTEVKDEELLELLLQEMDESNIREFTVPNSVLQGMPVWFIARDLDGDGQLSLREFAPTLSLNGVAFFGKLDTNGDGLLVPEEVRAFLSQGANSP